MAARDLALGLVLAIGAAAAGFAFQDQHYRLDMPGLPSDQRVLGHRDSPYTGMTWVASPSNNYLQLRFFEMVEGGICLEPTWAQLAADPRLGHLKPDATPAAAPGGIDPGTLNNSAYISFFPAGLLLNRTVPAAPRILVVGLGSGIGIAHLAHHFPQASIEVVDIDPAVIDMVRTQYPLLAWLEGQKTAAGEPRLTQVARDARAHIRARAGHGFHMVVLDAYTAGSTIPPHLMTREFFGECAATLAEGGTVFANVIGSYGEELGDGTVRGVKRRVVGGALRTLRAAGLPEAWVFPVLMAGDNPGAFDRAQSRNNILIVAKHPISPRRFPEGWERLRAWTPYPELEAGRYVSRQYQLIDQQANTGSTFVPAELIDAAVPAIAGRIEPRQPATGAPTHTLGAVLTDRALVEQARAAVVANAPSGSHLRGWRSLPGEAVLYRRTIDWTQFPRETWRTSVAFARDAAKHDPDLLVGPPDGPDRDGMEPTWLISDAPLFTDQRPNADIVNR